MSYSRRTRRVSRRSISILALTGFDNNEIAEALANLESGTQGLTDDDAAPEPPDVPVCQPGDLWMLGRHRLFCGDATDGDALAQLMGSDRADLVVTDPPYNVDYTGYTADKLTIAGDKMSPEQYMAFLCGTFSACRNVLKPGASLYVCHASSWQREFQDAIEQAGFAVRCQIIWAKNTFAWGHGRYKFQHEPLFYCHIAGQSDAWFGDKSQSTLWQEKKPAANRLHPTMKPVELLERAIVNSSKAGDLVLDLFGGSGSTLIACEKTARNARLMEVDPKYCDVIVQRWQDYTGRAATNESGQTFEALAATKRSAELQPATE